MQNFLRVSLLIFLFISCQKSTIKQVDVSHIPVDVKIDRFDVDFYTSTEKTLSSTKKKYPMLFPSDVDSIWVQKIKNKDEQELFSETQKVFNNVSAIEVQLKSLFQHVKYYNPKFNTPRVITMLTNIDYDNRVVFADSLLLISLDAYLGKKHEFYNDYPAYIKQNNTKEHIIVDVANSIINKQVLPNKNRLFLEKMISEGKKMYLLDAYLPKVFDKEKIGYSEEKFNWAINSEEDVWKYFIERDLLYSTDLKLNQRFLDIAPFSKFYLGNDTLSPGRIGVFIGWQIVRSYMQNNDVSLQQLMQIKEEEIFQKSKYKPKR
ncbi:protein involved in gliding motility GldB [Tenacibaculum adriaticum]|uniref:Protein involved in gliding motility GldB n=1 Tax=Tenacibaculum adriaticum TaxID=413713 RepID=A0A5S5DXI7_9FLAO|nr:gliding motility lipoprotein GldB [Tenacibaculum adriaticum]TYP99512.1 protein involved in gliding motility GldB [Tenacibaculum adriaticum]